MKQTWPYLRITLTPSLGEQVTAVLFSCGCSGTSSDSVGTAQDLRAAPQLTAWFTHSAARDEAAVRLAGMAAGLDPDQRLEVEPGNQQIEDWLARWREGQQPFPVGRRLLVIPGEGDPVPGEYAGRMVLRITPGLAFGTGHHETTLFCLRQLEEAAGEGTDFLDVGTGSGILALAAALLGCPRVVGTDIDPQAVVVAADNIAGHNLAHRVDLLVSADPGAALRRSFPLVAANILGSTLIRMAPVLAGPLLEPGGRLLLAGILAGDEEREVLDAYRARGLHCLSRVIDGEWAGLVLTRPHG